MSDPEYIIAFQNFVCANQEFIEYSVLSDVPDYAFDEESKPPSSGPTFVLSSTTKKDLMMRAQYRRHVSDTYGRANPIFSSLQGLVCLQRDLEIEERIPTEPSSS